MDINEFYKLTKNIYNKVFLSFEKYDPDLVEADYNLDSINILFNDGTRFVINRQPPVKQLWLATKNKGYHFDYIEEKNIWICNKTKKNFVTIFNQKVSERIQQPYNIEL